MNTRTVNVLEEFSDDIQRVCQEVLDLRDKIENLENEVSNLSTPAS